MTTSGERHQIPAEVADDAPPEPSPAETAPAESPSRGRRLAAAAAEPVAGALSFALDTAVTGLVELPSRGVRRMRRAPDPLPSLSDTYPEARFATPVEVGLRTLDVDDIRGTAVGGGDQRGADFLPLPEFRSGNWETRWLRLRRAHDRLTVLPPIDVVKYDGAYWVIDGHNRVALAKEAGQVGIDASVVELVPYGSRRTEPIVSLAASAEAFRAVRTRAESGERPDAVVQATVDTATLPSDAMLDAVDDTAAADDRPDAGDDGGRKGRTEDSG
jgi:hypothetical protein